MSFIHDSIKLVYSDMGYLPGYPYYLISDDEMFEAFIKEGGFFDDYYPCPYSEPYPESPITYEDPTKDREDPERYYHVSMYDEYVKLRQYIVDTIRSYQAKEIDTIPNWIYSYMLGNPIGIQSEDLDLYYLNDLLGFDSKQYPEFTEATATSCFNVSYAWIKKQPTKDRKRPVTMFGEPHVIKSLRLDQANIMIGSGGSGGGT